MRGWRGVMPCDVDKDTKGCVMQLEGEGVFDGLVGVGVGFVSFGLV